MISFVKLLHIFLRIPLALFIMVKPNLILLKNHKIIIFPSQIKHFKKELVVCGLEIGDRARDGSKKVNSQAASKKSLGPLYLLMSCNHKLQVQQVETCSGHQIVRRSYLAI